MSEETELYLEIETLLNTIENLLKEVRVRLVDQPEGNEGGK